MAISAGETLSLNNLAGATDNTQNSNVSLGSIKGSPSAGDDITLSSFGIDTVGQIDGGFTYQVEGTSEDIELLFTGKGGNFTSHIENQVGNFTWAVTPIFRGNMFKSGYIEIQANGNEKSKRRLAVSGMTPQGMSSQTLLTGSMEHTISVTFNDGFNDHASGHGVARTLTVHAVDSYDGNASALCLLPDTPITLQNGTTKLAEDIIEGDVLKGWHLNGLDTGSEDSWESWTQDTLGGNYQDVTVQDVVFSFAQKFYTFNGELTTTWEHPLFVSASEDGKYKFKEAGTITTNDKLIKSISGSLSVVNIDSIDLTTETQEIISLNVENADTYISNGYISHNKGGASHTDFAGPGMPQNLSFSGGVLSWSAPTPNANTGGITAYDVQIDNNSNFSSITLEYTEYSSTSISLTSQLSAGTYYARVRAIESGLKSNYMTIAGSNTAFTI